MQLKEVYTKCIIMLNTSLSSVSSYLSFQIMTVEAILLYLTRFAVNNLINMIVAIFMQYTKLFFNVLILMLMQMLATFCIFSSCFCLPYKQVLDV